MNQKKPRAFALEFTVDSDTKANGIRLGRDGKLILTYNGEPIRLATAAAEISYDRAKGRKVLVRSAVDPANPTINPHQSLEQFDAIFGVDVNTESIEGSPVSVASVLQLTAEKSATGVLWKDRPVGALEMRGVKGNPDRTAWRLICDHMSQSPGYDPSKRIGLVVDAHLDAINQMNKREAPVIGDWYLPPNVTLLYASDAAADSVQNLLIKASDRAATTVMRLIRDGKSKGTLHNADPGQGLDQFRVWAPDPPKS